MKKGIIEMKEKVIAVIPARLKSNRYPRKLLEPFLGKTVIEHVIDNTLKFDFVDKIVVVTDSEEIVDLVYGKYNIMSNQNRVKQAVIIKEATCGSERAYKYFLLDGSYDWYLSVACDEPTVNPEEVNRVWRENKFGRNEVSTLFSKFYCMDDLITNLSCKIVTTTKNYVLYHSRNIIPIRKSGSYFNLEMYKKHVGIFFFSNHLLSTYGKDLWKCQVNLEGLEQNRFLETNVPTKLYEIKHIGFGVDVEGQIPKLEKRVLKNA